MRLPNAKDAIVDVRKLEEYCLNPDHPRGKHKARVFQRALSVGRADAFELRERILEAVHIENCARGEADRYGVRYTLDFEWRRGGKDARVRTTWIVKTGEDVPRLTSCYVM